MSPLSSQLRRILLAMAVGIVTLLFLGTAMLAGSQSATIRTILNTDLQLHPDGMVWQNGATVGTIFPSNGGLTLTIPVPENDAASYQDAYLIRLPTPLPPGQMQLIIQSIEDTSGMLVYQVNPSAIQVFLPDIHPDSHTAVVVTLPAHYVAVPLIIQLRAFLTSIPLTIEIIIALLIGLLGIWLGFANRFSIGFPNSVLDSPPDHLGVMEVAILLKGTVSADHLAAMVVDFAQRGYIDILEKNESVYLIRDSQVEDGLHPYEKNFLNLLVSPGAQLQNLNQVLAELDRTLFSASVGELYSQVYAQLTERGYTLENPRYAHLRYKTAGIIIQILAVVFTALTAFGSAVNATGLVTLGIAAYIIGWGCYQAAGKLIPLSLKGQEIQWQCNSFIRYLSDLSLPLFSEKEDGRFFTYYPYALVCGVESAWRERFPRSAFFLPHWFTSLDKKEITPEGFAAAAAKVGSIIGNHMELAKDPNVD